MNEHKVKAFRIVACFWLAGWFLKVAFYGPYLSKVVFEYPVINALFPAVFLDPAVSLSFYCLPVMAASSFFFKKRASFIVSALIMAVSSLVLLLHINTYNDATFVSSFWVALWLLWLCCSKEEGKAFAKNAVFLAQMVIAVIFLGGFVGKLTEEYISGEIFYQIFMVQGQGSVVSDLSKHLPVASQRLLAAVTAKCVLFFELLLSVNFFIAARYAFLTVLVILPLLALFSSWRIFSVTACLVGLALAGLSLLKEKAGRNGC